MRSLLVCLLAFFLSVLPVVLLAQEVVCFSGMQYVLFPDGEALAVRPDGDVPADVVLPDQVPSGGRSYEVTMLGDSCFFCQRELVSVSLPRRLKSVGSYCFSGCTSLQRFILPPGVADLGAECFADCVSLQKVRLSRRIKVLPYRCFYGCGALAGVVLPPGLQELGAECFYASGIRFARIPPSGGAHRLPGVRVVHWVG